MTWENKVKEAIDTDARIRISDRMTRTAAKLEVKDGERVLSVSREWLNHDDFEGQMKDVQELVDNNQ